MSLWSKHCARCATTFLKHLHLFSARRDRGFNSESSDCECLPSTSIKLGTLFLSAARHDGAEGIVSVVKKSRISGLTFRFSLRRQGAQQERLEFHQRLSQSNESSTPGTPKFAEHLCQVAEPTMQLSAAFPSRNNIVHRITDI